MTLLFSFLVVSYTPGSWPILRYCHALEMPAGERANTRTDLRYLFTRLPEPIDLDLDLTTRTIYWTDRGDNTISRAPMDVGLDYDPATRLDREIVLEFRLVTDNFGNRDGWYIDDVAVTPQ